MYFTPLNVSSRKTHIHTATLRQSLISTRSMAPYLAFGGTLICNWDYLGTYHGRSLAVELAPKPPASVAQKQVNIHLKHLKVSQMGCKSWWPILTHVKYHNSTSLRRKLRTCHLCAVSEWSHVHGDQKALKNPCSICKMYAHHIWLSYLHPCPFIVAFWNNIHLTQSPKGGGWPHCKQSCKLPGPWRRDLESQFFPPCGAWKLHHAQPLRFLTMAGYAF